MSARALVLFAMGLAACRHDANDSAAPEVERTDACPWRAPTDLLVADVPSSYGERRMLDAHEVREDLACLREIFDKQYVAAEFYAARGVSLVDRVDALRAKIDAPIAATALVDRLLALHDGAPDVHLAYQLRWRKGEGGSLRVTQPALAPYRVEAAPELASCAGLRAVDAIVADDGTIATSFVGQLPASPEPPRVACRTKDGARVELPTIALLPAHVAEEDVTMQRHADGILAVRINGFPPGGSAGQARVLAALRTDPPPTAVLFDLRGNGGGDDTFAWLVAAALRTKDIPMAEVGGWDRMSPYAYASTFNYLTIAEYPAEQVAAARADFDRLVASGRTLADAPTKHDDTLSVQADEGGLEPRAHALDVPIVVLVDKGCASSCESFVDLLDDLPNVQVLGMPTAGAIAFGNVGMMVLPHSHIRVSTGWRHFVRAQHVEAIGYAPDVHVVAPNPDVAALAYLRNRVAKR